MATATRERPAKAAGTKKSALDELASLAASTKELEDEERSKIGSTNSFITLVQGNSAILKPASESYVKGVKPYDYVISKSKTVLGPELDATVLGMFKLYTEVEKKAKESDVGKTVAFWMPEDAVQMPLVPGSNFDRITPSGNTLHVTHWVFVYLHKYPEIEDGLLAFRSIGNKVQNELAKTINANSSLCTELRFTVTNQPIKSKNYEEAYYYPKFEIAGRNYKYEDGTIALTKGGLKEDELAEVLKRSHDLHESYKNMQMVSKKQVAVLAGPAGRKVLGGPKYEEDVDDEDVTF
jgi:hypothetical protein